MIGVVYQLNDVQKARRCANGAEYVRMAQEIGEEVLHSANAIILDYDFGASLRYFAGIDGKVWPETKAMLFDRMARKDRSASGEKLWNSMDMTALERYERFYAQYCPSYFILCRLMGELDAQPGLREWLGRYPIVAQGPRYIIYDLIPDGSEP